MRSKCVWIKNTNPDLRTETQKLKISKSPFSQTQQYHQILKPHSIKSIQKYNTTNPNKKISKSEQPISFKKKPSKLISFKKKNPANPPQANPNSVAMLPTDKLFSDGKLVPLQLSLVKCERAHPPKNCIAHPPKNHRPIVNPSARLDQVQGDGMAALSSLSLPLSHLGFVVGLGFLGGFC